MNQNDNEGQGTHGSEAAADAAAGQTDGGDALPAVDETVARLKEEIEHYKDQFLRTMAEMDNMRRRQERERSETLKYALEDVFKELLPVLDSFEQALPESDGTQDDSPFVEGMRKVKRQLLATLEKQGLAAVEALGQQFDPNVHQGIQRIESDAVETEQVQQEFAKGYTLNGRLLRPSMVSVLVPKG